MQDDKDREVCARLEYDLLAGLNHHGGDCYKKGDEWIVKERIFHDPGMTLRMSIYDGTPLEGRATINIEYWYE